MTLSEYKTLLERQDWTYEFSDDYIVWRRGLETMAVLRKGQVMFDPEFELWNQYAPAEMRKEGA